MNKLQNAREQIDSIDAEMSKLFCRRMKAAREAAEYKQENGLPVFDSSREAEVILRNASLIADDELKPYYISFLKYNMTLSKSYQHRLLEGMKIAYSGVPGAFGYIAAKSVFPDGIPVSYGSFGEAYRAVEEGKCDCAVLPIENSFAGDVAQVFDLMFFGSLFVTGIYDLEIVQNLLGNQGATTNTVKEVISHPQALDQCASYIEKHGYIPVEASNTAVAAKQAAQSGRTDIAAIASVETAVIYGLNVIDTNINQSNANTTRFAVFSRAQNRAADTDNHFIMFFTVKNEAGSLGRAVSVIGENGFNMKALKSRPTKELIWDYYFLVESLGNINGEKGRKMISELSEVCSSLKIVGSFEKEIMLKN
ncbi:MAG: prephenate dehydratase domain-containing protein [Eubacteriales bacterium]|nr:prephenate dehydratase domain-containing protein [Eubacteriales bacterium]